MQQSRCFPLYLLICRHSNDRTRAPTDVVSGAAGETVALTRSSASPMDMELGEGTGSSTGTTTTGSAAGSGAQTAVKKP